MYKLLGILPATGQAKKPGRWGRQESWQHSRFTKPGRQAARQGGKPASTRGSQSAAECGRAAPEPAPPPTDSGRIATMLSLDYIS